MLNKHACGITAVLRPEQALISTPALKGSLNGLTRAPLRSLFYHTAGRSAAVRGLQRYSDVNLSQKKKRIIWKSSKVPPTGCLPVNDSLL